MKVETLPSGMLRVRGLFENDKGTEYALDAKDLDKYLLVHPAQALDLIAWMNKVMVIFRSELYKK